MSNKFTVKVVYSIVCKFALQILKKAYLSVWNIINPGRTRQCLPNQKGYAYAIRYY